MGVPLQLSLNVILPSYQMDNDGAYDEDDYDEDCNYNDDDDDDFEDNSDDGESTFSAHFCTCGPSEEAEQVDD